MRAEKSPGLVPGIVRLSAQALGFRNLKHTGLVPVDENRGRKRPHISYGIAGVTPGTGVGPSVVNKGVESAGASVEASAVACFALAASTI